MGGWIYELEKPASLYTAHWEAPHKMVSAHSSTPRLSSRGIILLDDENLFHIRSFHASRRQEPNLDGR